MIKKPAHSAAVVAARLKSSLLTDAPIEKTNSVATSTKAQSMAENPATSVQNTFAATGTSVAADLEVLTEKSRPNAGLKGGLAAQLHAKTTENTPALRPLEFTQEEIETYQATNAKLAKANPSLAFVLADPDAFVADMKGRFATQKAKSPDRPYDFDIADIARPAFADMKKQLEAEITKVEGLLRIEEDSTFSFDWQGNGGKTAELKIGLEYLHELKAEISGHLAASEIPYRRTQELGFFTARALGLFDMPDIPLRDRALLRVDRYLQGYQDLSPQQEARSFRQNDFSVFQKQSPVGGFDMVHKTFEEAFFNPEKMEMVCVPTSESLGAGPFMRLVSYDVFLTGMTQEPAAADGFVRPGGDFWLHDMRHSSAIFGRRKEYNKEHNLSKPQQAKLEKQIDVWKNKLDKARSQIPDKKLRYAIGFSMFNLHHDRGYPMVPSTYKKKEAFNSVPKWLYTMLKVSGQHVGFDDPLQTLNQAQAWLEDFWGQHAGEEQAILNAQ